jgi:hypothetical protein
VVERLDAVWFARGVFGQQFGAKLPLLTRLHLSRFGTDSEEQDKYLYCCVRLLLADEFGKLFP